MNKNKGLGRGLDALLGSEPVMEPVAEARDAVVSLRIGDIDPNREQPRRTFGEEGLRELADSIRSVGVLQPILVRQSGARYVIIAGERRWRAARMAELAEIPAIVRDWDEVKRLQATLIENLQRDDLNPVEQAAGIRGLMEQCGLTQEETASRLGMSRPAVANLIRLLTLPEEVLAYVRDGRLSAGHARALVPLERERQLALAKLAVEQGWSVRQLERACAEPVKADEPARKTPMPPECKQLERMARDVFGTRAQLRGDMDKGKLVLEYKSADDLQRIWDVLEFMRQSES